MTHASNKVLCDDPRMDRSEGQLAGLHRHARARRHCSSSSPALPRFTADDFPRCPPSWSFLQCWAFTAQPAQRGRCNRYVVSSSPRAIATEHLDTSSAMRTSRIRVDRLIDGARSVRPRQLRSRRRIGQGVRVPGDTSSGKNPSAILGLGIGRLHPIFGHVRSRTLVQPTPFRSALTVIRRGSRTAGSHRVHACGAVGGTVRTRIG